jgi:hypothetical protein
VKGEPADSQARELIARAAKIDVTPPPGARARVWAEIEQRRRRQLRVRVHWGAFTAGALCTALVLLAVWPRHRDERSSTELVTASADGPALVDLHGAGRMVAGPGTRAQLDRNAEEVTVRLERGSLLAHVAPRAHRSPFVIETPAFTARVVGTVLRVTAHDDGSGSVVVGRGAVEVVPHDKASAPVLVRSGEHWPADTTDTPSPDELDRLGTADLEGTDPRAFAPPSAAAAPAKESCAALHGEPAVRCYLRLGDESDPVRAESALYQAGWIRMREMHDAAFALGVWERERQRFADGVLREEVQTSIIDALVALRRSSAAKAEIDDYLRAHPRGLRSAEMHFVRGTLLREQDRSCRRARREFELALEHPSEPWAARARAARNACR